LMGNNGGSSTDKTIYWKTYAPVDMKTAIANGTIAGAVSWEPYVSDSVLAGTGKVLIRSESIWENHPCCVLATRTAYAEQNPDAVAAFIAAEIVADKWLTDTLANPKSANYTLLLNMGAQFSNRNVSVVNESLSHIEYGTLISTQDINWFVNYTNSYESLGLYTTNITARGYSNSTDFVDHLVNGSYYTAALSVLKSDQIKYNINVGYLVGDLHQFARVIAMNTTVGGGTSIFEQYGISVSSPNLAGYASGGAIMDAFKGGYIDIGYLGAAPVLLKSINAGVEVTILCRANSEGSAIIVGDEISDFADLNGKIVGVPGTATIQYLMLLYYAHELGYVVKAA